MRHRATLNLAEARRLPPRGLFRKDTVFLMPWGSYTAYELSFEGYVLIMRGL